MEINWGSEIVKSLINIVVSGVGVGFFIKAYIQHRFARNLQVEAERLKYDLQKSMISEQFTIGNRQTIYPELYKEIKINQSRINWRNGVTTQSTAILQDSEADLSPENITIKLALLNDKYLFDKLYLSKNISDLTERIIEALFAFNHSKFVEKKDKTKDIDKLDMMVVELLQDMQFELLSQSQPEDT